MNTGKLDTQMNVAEQPHAECKLRRQLLGSLPLAPLHLGCLLALRGKIQKSADKKIVSLPSYSKVDDTRKFIKNIAASEDAQPSRISITRARGDFLRTSPRADMMTRVGEKISLAPTIAALAGHSKRRLQSTN